MGVIPLQYRLIAINIVNIPWNAFLSYQNSKGGQKVADVEMSKID